MAQRIISRILGCLLIAAASLKLYGTNVTPFAQYGRLLNPTIQFAAIEWEIVLGIWLLTGRKPLGAWLAALFTFLLFASVSFYLGAMGQNSCGCFGSLRASPWHAFAVDVAALVLLGIARPNFRALRGFSRARWRAAMLHGAGAIAIAAALGAGSAGLAVLIFGSPDAALARLRGERISIQPRLVDIGSGQPGQTVEAKIEVVNRLDRSMLIEGGTSDCSCLAIQDLPLTLAPGEAHHVSVRIRLPDTPGYLNRKAYLWTDCPGAQRVLFGLTGKVDPPLETSAAVNVRSC